MAVIYLLRHGTSEWNILKKWQGETDTNLAPVGQEQAKKRAQKFLEQGIKFDIAYTSDLRRASHSCELIMSDCGQDDAAIIHEKRLRECGLGEFEGMEKKDIYGPHYSELWSFLDSLSHEKRIRTPYFEGLETPLDVGTRAIKCLRDALHDKQTNIAMAITHSTVIESVLAVGFGAVFDSIETENLCWIRFREVNSRLVIDDSEGVNFRVSIDAMPSEATASKQPLIRLPEIFVSLVVFAVLSVMFGRVSERKEMTVANGVDLCETNSPLFAEFFNSIGALCITAAGLYAVMQFRRMNLSPGLLHWISQGTFGLGLSLLYSHIWLGSSHWFLSTTLAVIVALLAPLSLKKEAVTVHELIVFGVVVALILSIHGNSNSSLFLVLMLSVSLAVYSVATVPLSQSLDPRVSEACIQGLVGLVAGGLCVGLDNLVCVNRVVTLRAVGYFLLSLSVCPLLLATFVEKTNRAWLQPRAVFGVAFPQLGVAVPDDEKLTQK